MENGLFLCIYENTLTSLILFISHNIHNIIKSTVIYVIAVFNSVATGTDEHVPGHPTTDEDIVGLKLISEAGNAKMNIKKMRRETVTARTR